jgi:hypothetical protein
MGVAAMRGKYHDLHCAAFFSELSAFPRVPRFRTANRTSVAVDDRTTGRLP